MFRAYVSMALLGILLLPPCSAVASESDPIADFLKHRNVLLSVDFEFGSNRLTASSQAEIDRIVEDLKSLLGDNKVIRIEGFATPEGKEDYNIILSMQRAMAVQEYLQGRHGFELDLFFNGFGSGKAPAEKRVQLAFYEDTLGLTVAQVDSVVTE